MSWLDTTLNLDADDAAARRATLTMHTGDPGSTGANQDASAALSWENGGDPGTVSTVQPATPGVAYAAPSVNLSADSTYTHYGFRDGGGAWLGGFPLPQPIQTTAAETRTIPVRIGPNA